MAVEFQRQGEGSIMLSEPGNAGRYLTAIPGFSPGRNSSCKLGEHADHFLPPSILPRSSSPRSSSFWLAMMERDDDENVLQLWEKDFGASDHFTKDGFFALRLKGTVTDDYYLSLPIDPEAKFSMLELKRVRYPTMELVCEAFQWEEDDGVIRKPERDARPRPRRRIVN